MMQKVAFRTPSSQPPSLKGWQGGTDIQEIDAGASQEFSLLGSQVGRVHQSPKKAFFDETRGQGFQSAMLMMSGVLEHGADEQIIAGLHISSEELGATCRMTAARSWSSRGLSSLLNCGASGQATS
jgi:hypothetical protein